MSKILKGYEDKDQYFAPEDMVDECLTILKEKLMELGIDEKKYTYIEPSAGDGAFLIKLPKDRRIGIDIEPRHEEIIEGDFLKWKPTEELNYITVGGPPFGHRGDLAVKFMNHTSQFSNVVAFILPEYFIHKNRYYCGYKIQNLRLVHSIPLSSEFLYPNGEKVNIPIKIFFQIWVTSNV